MKIRPGLLGSRRIVCRHIPPAPGCHFGPEPWPRSPGKFLPVLPAVGRAEQGGVFHAGVDGIGIGERRFEMPDALELPGMRRAVVPLVRAGDAVVDELVAHRLPGLAAVVAALDHLPEPAAGLRGVDPIRIDGRAFEMIDLPAAEERAVDVPLLALAVGGQDERAFAGADENANGGHGYFLRHGIASTRISLTVGIKRLANGTTISSSYATTDRTDKLSGKFEGESIAANLIRRGP